MVSKAGGDTQINAMIVADLSSKVCIASKPDHAEPCVIIAATRGNRQHHIRHDTIVKYVWPLELSTVTSPNVSRDHIMTQDWLEYS